MREKRGTKRWRGTEIIQESSGNDGKVILAMPS